jgi:hypothetical protein
MTSKRRNDNFLLRLVLNVQEGDATDDAISSAAGYKKKKTQPVA